MQKTQSTRKELEKEKILPLQTPIEPDQVVDTRICYVCGHDATTICAHCKMPVCEEHRQQVQEYVTKIALALCDECADHYEGVIMPR